MDITHSYKGLGLDYLKARTGVPAFASFVVSHVVPEIIDKNAALSIVEFGVGSGQQTEFVEKELNRKGLKKYKIYAYDKSFQSLQSEKPGQLNILEKRIQTGEITSRVIPAKLDFDVNDLPPLDSSIDFSYMAHVFHHLKNRHKLLQEIFRITKPGGIFFILGAVIEDLENHPLNEFFPMKYKYDKNRYPTYAELKQIFEDANFTFEHPFVLGKNYERPIDRAFLTSVENTTLDSVLLMIKRNDVTSFQEGVLRVKSEVEKAEKSGVYRMCSLGMAKVFWGKKI